MNLNLYGHHHNQPLTSGLKLARVIGASHDQYLLATASGQFQAQVAGRLANLAISAEDFPTVGDWVQVRVPANASDNAIIERMNYSGMNSQVSKITLENIVNCESQGVLMIPTRPLGWPEL